MHPLILFVIIFFGILFVAGLFIATWFISKNRVKNKPENAVILKKNGQEIIAYKGIMDGLPSKKCIKYKYNKDRFVLVPNEYTIEYIKNRRLIFIGRDGQVISQPFEKTQSLTASEREKLIYEFIESKIGGDAIREIKGKSTVNVIMIAVIGFAVGVACVFIFNFVSDKYMNKEPNITTENEKPVITEQYVPITEEK